MFVVSKAFVRWQR